MKTFRPPLAAAAALFAFASLALAQDHSGHGTGSAMALPEACQAAEAPAMAGMRDMESAMENMGEHQKAFMEGMMATEGPMMKAMMAEDADIAFACAMIPHHQGAIHMAEVELEHGDSDEMKALAQKIINDQKKEIEQLTNWIEKQTQ
jgi:uncharacterized protein (DUF305 family)